MKYEYLVLDMSESHLMSDEGTEELDSMEALDTIRLQDALKNSRLILFVGIAGKGESICLK